VQLIETDDRTAHLSGLDLPADAVASTDIVEEFPLVEGLARRELASTASTNSRHSARTSREP
jgi:hypothetical protein